MDPDGPVVRRLGPADVELVLTAAGLFDEHPRRDWTERFLTRDGHHLFLAHLDGRPVGFVTGIEITHPDKGTEMLLYELGVDEASRRQGIGRALVHALLDLSRTLGCVGMWVPIEPDNPAAVATYRSAGADDPEPASVMTWTIG